ncbi:MAG: xylulokinase [Spirochaetes bacterium]|nr:xylulokinase [Spirochaetota bacterium]
MKKYVAAIDIGTSGSKAIILDDKAAVVASATEEYPLHSPRPSWNEQDPADWWQGACDSLKKAIQKAGVSPNDIGALGLSGQMHGLVPLDKDGNVIRRAYLWNDSRCDKQCRDVIEKLGGLDKLLGYTNNNLLPGYQGGKIIWLREEEPQNYERMAKALLPKDYLRYMLTGEYATEVSDASGTGFFDVKKRAWSEELIKKLDLPMSLFPKAFESDHITGKITARAAELTGLAEGTPVVGGGGDAVIQTTGMGIIKDGVLGVILGTSGNVTMGMSKYQDNKGGTLQFFCNNASDLYHVMGVQLAGGGSYQWYRNTLCQEEIRQAKELGVDPYELMNKAAASSPAGSKRVLYLPYLSGERCPYSDPNLRAAFIGLSQGYTKAEITRSVMEGVTYGLRQIGDAMLAIAPVSMSHIIVSGGGGSSPLWRQIISDIFQLPVKKLAGGEEGGAYGAGLVAGIGIGLWKNLAEACSNVKVATVDEPNNANKAIYDEMFGIYNDMYKTLKPIYDRLAAG